MLVPYPMVNFAPTDPGEPDVEILKIEDWPSDTKLFWNLLSVYNFNSYPFNVESERLKTKLLFLIDVRSGLISDIVWELPPVDAIPTTLGIDFPASMLVSDNLMLLSSTLYT